VEQINYNDIHNSNVDFYVGTGEGEVFTSLEEADQYYTSKYGENWQEIIESIGGGGNHIEVSEQLIREKMKGSEYSSQQQSVSLPRIQEDVDRLLAGETPPPIQVDLSTNVIVDGNHRYIASKITGIPVEVQPYTGGYTHRIVSWDQIIIDPDTWIWLD